MGFAAVLFLLCVTCALFPRQEQIFIDPRGFNKCDESRTSLQGCCPCACSRLSRKQLGCQEEWWQRTSTFRPRLIETHTSAGTLSMNLPFLLIKLTDSLGTFREMHVQLPSLQEPFFAPLLKVALRCGKSEAYSVMLRHAQAPPTGVVGGNRKTSNPTIRT